MLDGITELGLHSYCGALGITCTTRVLVLGASRLFCARECLAGIMVTVQHAIRADRSEHLQVHLQIGHARHARTDPRTNPGAYAQPDAGADACTDASADPSAYAGTNAGVHARDGRGSG